MNSPLLPLDALELALTPAAPAAAQGDSAAAQFGPWFTRELAEVDAQMRVAERGLQQLAAGGPVQLHDTMLQMEQARLAFQLAIQVRSRVLEAYQDVMRMQV